MTNIIKMFGWTKKPPIPVELERSDVVSSWDSRFQELAELTLQQARQITLLNARVAILEREIDVAVTGIPTVYQHIDDTTAFATMAGDRNNIISATFNSQPELFIDSSDHRIEDTERKLEPNL